MRLNGFLVLLRKYREGTLSDNKRKAMDAWYSSLKGSSEVADESRVKERIWGGINARTSESIPEEPEDFRRALWWKNTWFRSAAAVLLVTGISFFYWPRPEPVLIANETYGEEPASTWENISNAGETTKEVLLADGSRVILEPGSNISYPESFAKDNRTVLTEGNVFFDVARDPERPFFAHAGEVVVKVLGTSFTVRQIENNGAATEVAVITGKVMVGQKQNRKQHIASEPILLTPNKKVTFFKNSSRYITGLVENPVIVGKSDEFIAPETFDFDDVPLSDIVEKLEKAYGVDILIESQSIQSCQITADLSSDNLFGKLEVICAILNGHYEVKGSTILLSGGMCNVL